MDKNVNIPIRRQCEPTDNIIYSMYCHVLSMPSQPQNANKISVDIATRWIHCFTGQKNSTHTHTRSLSLTDSHTSLRCSLHYVKTKRLDKMCLHLTLPQNSIYFVLVAISHITYYKSICIKKIHFRGIEFCVPTLFFPLPSNLLLAFIRWNFKFEIPANHRTYKNI